MSKKKKKKNEVEILDERFLDCGFDNSCYPDYERDKMIFALVKGIMILVCFFIIPGIFIYKTDFASTSQAVIPTTQSTNIWNGVTTIYINNLKLNKKTFKTPPYYDKNGGWYSYGVDIDKSEYTYTVEGSSATRTIPAKYCTIYTDVQDGEKMYIEVQSKAIHDEYKIHVPDNYFNVNFE